MRHFCRTRVGMCGIVGGIVSIVFLLIVFVAELFPKAHASSCSTVSVNYGDVLTPAQWNDYLNRACTVVNGLLDNGNIANGANISGAKLAPNSVTALQIATGAVTTDEILNATVGTIDLANGAVTNAKLAANAVDSNSIANGSVLPEDLAPGATPGSASRLPYNVEAGLSSGTPHTAYMRAKFDMTVPDSMTVVDTLVCAGYYYAVVNVASGVIQDYLVKVNTQTMVQVGSNVLLDAGDNPVDATCGRDGTVWVLTNGTVKKIRRVSTANPPVVTDHIILSNAPTSADNVVAIVSDPNTINLFVAGSEAAVANDRIIWKVAASPSPVADPNIVQANRYNHGSAVSFVDMIFTNKDGVDRLAALQGQTTGPILTFNVSGVVTLVENIAVDTLSTAATSFEFDGSMFIICGAQIDCSYVDYSLGTKLTSIVLDWTAAANSPDGVPSHSIFTGTQFAWQQVDGEVDFLQPPYYVSASRVQDVPLNGVALFGTPNPVGLATDGVSLYVTTEKGPVSDLRFIVLRYLQN